MKEIELQKLPKVELHCHLDGSLSKEFIESRLGREVQDEELSVSDDCESLVEYLEKFDLPNQCLRDEEGLSQAAFDVAKQMKGENVCYGELRFAPLLSVTEQMNVEQVITAVLKGLERGKKELGIETNVIVCAMRHHSEQDNYKMIKTAREFLGNGVCAADLAGAEAQYPMSEFMELFRNTKKLGMPFTIHAGECGNAGNIADAVEAGAGRIGHGIAMRGNVQLQKQLLDAHIGIEMCPLSNLQTKASTTADYPMKEFLDRGLLVTVNTDNRTVSNTSMTRELAFIQKQYGIADEEVIRMTKNAIEAAFAGDDVKHRLWQKLSEI